jgi:hypothetical protein
LISLSNPPLPEVSLGRASPPTPLSPCAPEFGNSGQNHPHGEAPVSFGRLPWQTSTTCAQRPRLRPPARFAAVGTSSIARSPASSALLHLPAHHPLSRARAPPAVAMQIRRRGRRRSFLPPPWATTARRRGSPPPKPTPLSLPELETGEREMGERWRRETGAEWFHPIDFDGQSEPASWGYIPMESFRSRRSHPNNRGSRPPLPN